jgi:hypothetical protein
VVLQNAAEYFVMTKILGIQKQFATLVFRVVHESSSKEILFKKWKRFF